jgi:hypothetical protein
LFVPTVKKKASLLYTDMERLLYFYLILYVAALDHGNSANAIIRVAAFRLHADPNVELFHVGSPCVTPSVKVVVVNGSSSLSARARRGGAPRARGLCVFVASA